MKMLAFINLIICLIIVLVLMPKFIDYLKNQSFKQTVSEYALEDDKKKAGTPIMGGILFIIVPIICSFIIKPSMIKDLEAIIVMLAFLGYGLIGFWDDYLISIKKNNDGLSPKAKLLSQVILAAIFFFIYRNNADLSLKFPLLNKTVDLGMLYFVLVLFMFAGSSNAVNLTDGMDGLSSGVVIIALIPFLVITLLQQKYNLVILIMGLIGSLLGYLYYNKKPAKVFMGDTGALALGGILAALAMVTKKELPLILIAGVPVIETLCVMLQILAVKTIHRRIFTYTPIHYAFRIKGMPEKSIVYMFYMAEIVFAILGLLVALR